MPLNVKNLSQMFQKDVFSNKGVYCGKVVNLKLDLRKFRVSSILVEAAKGSYLAEMVGGKKGIIIPFRMIQSIGDIVIIKHISAPALGEEEEIMAETEKGLGALP
jgi:sporulation protein YlmC with PRC-barrel domain